MSVQVNSDNRIYDNKNLSLLKDLNNNPAPILKKTPTVENADNNIKALEKFLDKNDEYLAALPPIDCEYRYMPNLLNNKIDKNALLEAAKSEMCAEKMSVKEFDENFLEEGLTSKALDINNDNNIDISEYAANMLAADMLSKEKPNINNIDGTFNGKGLNAVLEYSKLSNLAAATKLYSNIYKTYDLGETHN